MAYWTPKLTSSSAPSATSEARSDTRAGHYERKLHTSAGEVTLKVPKLRQLKFETAIIERYKRRESSVEEALIEMYLAGVSTRRVEDNESCLPQAARVNERRNDRATREQRPRLQGREQAQQARL